MLSVLVQLTVTDSSHVVGHLLRALRCVRKAGSLRLTSGVDRGRTLLSGLGADRQCSVEGRGGVLLRAAGRCVRALRVTVQDDYRLCIVVGLTARWPVVALHLCR